MADDATQIEEDELPPEENSGGVDKLAPQHAHRHVQPAPRKRKPFARSFFVLKGLLTIFLFVIAIALLTLMGRSVALPKWAVDRVETRVNADLKDERIELESISFGLRDEAFRPTVNVEGLELFNRNNVPMLELPMLTSKLDTSELFFGRVKLETIELDGASLELTRDENGQIALAFGAQMGDGKVKTGSMAEVLKQIDVWFAEPWMQELEEASAHDLTIRLTDERTNDVTVVEKGLLKLTNEENVIALNVSFNLDQPSGTPAQLFFSADKAKGSEGARLVGKFTDLRARDLAEQVSALNFLNVLDAPASGALTAEIDENGQVASLAGTLNLDKGVLRPTEQAKPVPFNSAKSYLRYQAATGRLVFDQILLDSPQMRLNATGHADLSNFVAGIPETLLGQFRFTDVRLAPEGFFEAPVSFANGSLDLRYQPKELALDIGQLVLRNDGAELVASGAVDVLPEGWAVSLDAGIDEIDHIRLMALWPENAVAKTRKWLTDNIQGGQVRRARAAIRALPDKPISAAVSFDFMDASVKFLKTLPPVQNAMGYASISGNAFNLSLQSGQVIAGDDAPMEAGGSVMQIPDMTSKPAVGIFDLAITGPASTALYLLDQKPFEFLSKSGLSTDIATGTAKISTRLTVPLRSKVEIEDVGYVVSAEVRKVVSDTLVKGRKIRSDLMEVLAGDGSLSIGGKGTIDGIPMDVQWSRNIGAGTGKNSKVEGTIELSPKMLDVFNVGLPDGSVTGKGQGNIEISLVQGAAPEAKLTSNLRGVGLNISALGWSKPRGSSGSLSLDLTMGDTPRVNNVTVNASGLEATGSVTLKPNGGGLDKAIFTPLRIAGKLNSRVEVIGRGGNRQPQVSIKGGTIDIRKFGVTTGGSSAGGPPLEFELDRLVVTDTIAMDQFRGSFRNEKGMDGTFKANLNGKAPITGTVIPTNKGPAVRILSDNGGRVISASGILENVNGGDMSLTLQPNGKPGQFDGALEITNARVKKAPALADLLSALSVIGLLEQLTGDGILFTKTEARFLLAPSGVTLSRSSAVGPSMGITMDGVFDTNTRRMDMRGVVSPIYAVNGLFGALFSPRKGEGLFGFNYTLKGSSDGPRVGVNPLSVLTPGVFREIFRQPPPKLKN
ncbi:MAG: DUF3971 domain-containing protein [Litoreibacter sp.]|uniref:YhdP family protein n=1 Tax=Litoreibacter sp. TaxID=1969459 RepID=UPI00329904CD